MKQIINEKFWSEYARLYNKFYPKFQHELLSHISQYGKGQTADLGTGTGKLFQHLNKNSNIEHLIAIDSNKQMLELTKKNAKSHLTSFPYQIKHTELNQLPHSENGQYDSIFMVNVLYANQNPIEIIKTANSHLKQNGHLIIADMKRTVQIEKPFQQIKKEYHNEQEDVDKYYNANKILSQGATPRTFSLLELESIIHLTGTHQTIEKREDFFLNNANCVISKKLN